ncbi:hypothetical protein B2M27_06990 [Kluyvera intermedia]|uniref:Baseplate protein J-like domain-containing protein n=1 Tax=Kluyvera intermedia TaxID=61648 RepID=A0ABX3UIR1_KLUIN|nr:hypothetical protein [Kluyvera intermedia]ORJ51183.1 hypothetical protein B2M27_06990 [Kluyvera intermedia]
MTESLELDFTEEIYYSIGNNPSIKEIVASLQGWETLIKQSRGVLSELTGAHILDVEVRVSKLEVGSLKEKLLIRLLFGNEEELNKFLDDVRTKYIGEGKVRNALIWAVIIALAGTALLAVSKLMAPSNTSHFEANNNTIINIGAGQTEITPERIQAIIDSSVTDKKALAKSAVKILAPARNDENATLIIGSGDVKYTLPAETIIKTPTDVEFPSDTYTRDHSDVDLEIRATDLDNPEKWAAVIPGLVDRRVKLVLAPGINPDDLKRLYTARADVTITYKHTSAKSDPYKPTEIFLKSIITDSQ